MVDGDQTIHAYENIESGLCQLLISDEAKIEALTKAIFEGR